MDGSVWRGLTFLTSLTPPFSSPKPEDEAQWCEIQTGPGYKKNTKHTLKRRETTVENQLKIAKLTLGEEKGGKSLGLSRELSMAREIASDQVLEDAAVGWVGHLWYVNTLM